MDDFQIFPHLPSELRIKIWEMTFPEPRVVPVRFNRTTKRYTSTAAPLPQAHVCSEARSLFFERYTRLVLSPKYESTIFFDFARDTLFFDDLDCSPHGDLSLDLATSPHADRILYLAIDAQLWEVLRVFNYDSLSEVKHMPKLRKVSLVMSKDHDRGLQQRPTAGHGMGNLIMGPESNTVGSEIRHVHWYVETLRLELKQRLEQYWGGSQPHIQMWLL